MRYGTRFAADHGKALRYSGDDAAETFLLTLRNQRSFSTQRVTLNKCQMSFNVQLTRGWNAVVAHVPLTFMSPTSVVMSAKKAYALWRILDSGQERL